MDHADPVAKALTILHQSRDDLMAEVRRVEAAISALEQPMGARSPSAHGLDRPSVRTMAVRLMDEGNRDWSAGEIIAEYRNRGTPVHGKDPTNALRAALADAKKQRMIVPTSFGRYKSAKFAEPSTTNGQVAWIVPEEEDPVLT